MGHGPGRHPRQRRAGRGDADQPVEQGAEIVDRADEDRWGSATSGRPIRAPQTMPRSSAKSSVGSTTDARVRYAADEKDEQDEADRAKVRQQHEARSSSHACCRSLHRANAYRLENLPRRACSTMPRSTAESEVPLLNRLSLMTALRDIDDGQG